MNTTPPLARLRARLRMRHLVLLDELGHSHNLHRCAVSMNLTQPAVSKLLKEVEELLGESLFERSRTGVTPNALGARMIEHARLLLTDLESSYAELSAIRAGATGSVRLGVFPVAVPRLLALAVEHLQNQHPGLHLDIREGLEDTLLPALRGGELDFVVGRLVMESTSEDLHCDILFDEPTVVVAAPNHPLHAQTTLKGADVERYQWILPSSNASLYALVASALATLGAGFPRVAITSGSPLIIISLLQHSQLLAAIPLRMAQYMADHGHVAILPIPLATRLHPVAITRRRHAELTSAAAAALAAFKHAAQQLQLAAPSPQP